ncbi:putative glycolipid-binding domain-containing protein [Pseudalkalibacillus sp. Hm43]|uniref:putative glycolipid-binding domain-containing protein n=1 Tax=Pseudalkalibacillus sp. Hm43 TaxID=3450742 RepID=UPI003F42C8D7
MLKVMWENVEAYGSEVLELNKEDTMVKVDSTILFMDEVPHQVSYSLHLENWVTRDLEIVVDSHHTLKLTSNGNGNWFKENGERIVALEGAIDVDLSATPFSNSLPVNRLEWKRNQSRDFEMVYVSIPSLVYKKVKQRYTYLEHTDTHRLFQYESGTFQTEIKVDEHGLIVDYPELFKRRY